MEGPQLIRARSSSVSACQPVVNAIFLSIAGAVKDFVGFCRSCLSITGCIRHRFESAPFTLSTQDIERTIQNPEKGQQLHADREPALLLSHRPLSLPGVELI